MTPHINSIQRGKAARAPRLVVYGEEGIGKSTWASSPEGSVGVPTEDGLDQIDCARFQTARTYEDVVAMLTAVRDEKHDFRNVFLDSLDWTERLIWDRVCRDFAVKSIERADGGFGKGYTHALTYWREILSLLDQIREQRNMSVILVAHAKVERFEDPEAPAFDRWTPRLHKHACALVCEWVDAVLFACRKRRVDAVTGKASPIGAGGGERILRTTGSPACVAKNRFGLPPELPLSWDAFVEALAPKEAAHA